MDKSRMRKFLVYVGIFCSIVSFISFLLSLALPGVGWFVATFTLIATSLLVPFIGKRYVIVTFIVNSIHLFTLGPLSLLGQSGPLQLPIFYLVIFIIVPTVIALISIFAPASSFMKKRKP
jgi:hypothetical protein